MRDPEKRFGGLLPFSAADREMYHQNHTKNSFRFRMGGEDPNSFVSNTFLPVSLGIEGMYLL